LNKFYASLPHLKRKATRYGTKVAPSNSELFAEEDWSMRGFTKKFLTFGTLLVLCGSLPAGAQESQESGPEYKELESAFQPFVGIYLGKMKTYEGEKRARLTLKTISVTLKNPNRPEDTPVPALGGTLELCVKEKQEECFSTKSDQSYILTAAVFHYSTFNPATSKLHLYSTDSITLHVDAIAKDNSINGKVYSGPDHEGYIGSISVSK
jgi:hypothetical protein